MLTALPNFFEVLIQAGNSARFLDDTQTAAAYYDEAAKVHADSWIPAYNLACLRALGGDPQAAMVLLGQAVDLGFGGTNLLDTNEDFASLRALPEWPALVVTLKNRTLRPAVEGFIACLGEIASEARRAPAAGY